MYSLQLSFVFCFSIDSTYNDGVSIPYLPRIAITHLCVVCEKKKKLWRRSDAKEQFPETQLQHRATRHSRTHLSSQTIVQQLVEFTIDASINRSDTERMTLSDLNAYVLRKYVLLYINLRSSQTTDSFCLFFLFLFWIEKFTFNFPSYSTSVARRTLVNINVFARFHSHTTHTFSTICRWIKLHSEREKKKPN